jgi:hypothetical protein
LIDLSVDRDKPGNLVACGYRYSVSQNAMVGFVYRSPDAGYTWHEALKDDSSLWVTEESCASGAEGRVFFMDESALLDHGKARDGIPLQDRGDIHLYTSLDSGKNWTMMSKRGWFDHTAMAVDWSPGPRRGRMYLFGQTSSKDAFGTFSEVQVMTTDDGKTLHGPVSVPKPTDFRYVAAYASAAKMLPNGEVVGTFLTNRGPSTNTVHPDQRSTTHVEVFATRDGGTTLEGIADFGAIQPCLGAMPSLDVNLHDGTIYVVWGALEHGHCQTAISSSTDGGRTWSPSRRLAVASDAYVPAIALNDNGIVGLFWLEQTELHCWKFAASSDKGQTFSNPIPVSRCVGGSRTADLSQSARDASSAVHLEGTGAGWGLEPDAIGFSVIAARDGLIPDRTGLAADSSGVFHAAWPEPTDQNGALWSTSISVGQTRPKTFISESAIDVSHEVALEFANSVFENTSGMYGVDVTVTNTGSKPIDGQIFLRVENAYSRFFRNVTARGSDNEMGPGGAIWTVWPESNKDRLEPGDRTFPRRISFLLTNTISEPVAFGDLLAVKVKAFSDP